MTTERLSPSAGAPRRPSCTAVLLGVYARGGPAWVLGFVAMVPWLLVLDRAGTVRGALFGGALMSIGFMAATFHWFGAAIGSYTGLGALPATLALIVLAPVLQPQFIAYALVRHWLRRGHGTALCALAAASAWVACEWLLPKLLGDTLGHGLFTSALLRQGADLGGAAGLTFLLLLVNEALAAALRRHGQGVRAWLRPLALGLAIVAGLAVYGMARLSVLKRPPAADAPTLRVAMVQASIIDYERLRGEMGAYAVVRHVLDTHYALSWSAIRDHQADVLLWSETVYPTTFGSPRSEDGAALDAELQGFVDAAGGALVSALRLDEPGGTTRATFLEGHGVWPFAIPTPSPYRILAALADRSGAAGACCRCLQLAAATARACCRSRADGAGQRGR